MDVLDDLYDLDLERGLLLDPLALFESRSDRDSRVLSRLLLRVLVRFDLELERDLCLELPLVLTEGLEELFSERFGDLDLDLLCVFLSFLLCGLRLRCFFLLEVSDDVL